MPKPCPPPSRPRCLLGKFPSSTPITLLPTGYLVQLTQLILQLTTCEQHARPIWMKSTEGLKEKIPEVLELTRVKRHKGQNNNCREGQDTHCCSQGRRGQASGCLLPGPQDPRDCGGGSLQGILRKLPLTSLIMSRPLWQGPGGRPKKEAGPGLRADGG